MLAEAIRAAAEPFSVLGHPNGQVIRPARVAAIAGEQGVPGWQVEIAALEAEIIPLHYVRNLARFGVPGQIKLLRTAVTVVGAGAPIRKCLENLAAYGVGRLRVVTVDGPPTTGGNGASPARRGPSPLPPPPSRIDGRGSDGPALAGAASNLNSSLETSTVSVDLRHGDPTSHFASPDVVAACVEDVTEEMLLQAVCRRLEAPLVVAGLQGSIGQATTILPGDPGVALIYQDDHPHLDRSRPGSLREQRLHGLVVGTWLADQVIALRLGLGEVLQNRLLYADMGSGEIHTYPLGGRPSR
jgi:molybdopterin/thiamine biosynthesis adenylyltransferase